MADDWDLQAVVRGCATNTTTTSCSGTTTSTSTASCSTDVYQRLAGTGRSFEQGQPGQGQGQDGNFIYLQDLFFEPRNGIQELNDLYKPFFQKTSPPVSPQSNSIPISPLSVLGEFQDLSQLQQNPQGQQSQRQNIYQPKQSLLRTGASSSHNPSPRSKRRKNQMKRVCQVPAEALSSDTWSWRKYGQKPIKGSPYPRGYYRCSTSKGCLARKQVERNRSDPGMFIVTYTAEHNHPMPTHRNTLAGSTRQKPATVTGNSDDTNKPDSSPMVSSGTSLSPAPEKLELESSSKEEIMEEEDDDINAPEMPMDDDFFEGLEELAEKSSAGDIFSGHLPPSSQSMQFPWLATNATTTAAGGV